MAQQHQQRSIITLPTRQLNDSRGNNSNSNSNNSSNKNNKNNNDNNNAKMGDSRVRLRSSYKVGPYGALLVMASLFQCSSAAGSFEVGATCKGGADK